MKICMIAGAFPPAKCGIGDYTERLCSGLSSLGLTVDVITSACYQQEDYGQKPFRVHAMVKNWGLSELTAVTQQVERLKPDIVHIQYPNKEYGKSLFINILPWWLKQRTKARIVETVHEYTIFTYKGKLRNLLNYLASDAIIIVEKGYEPAIKTFYPPFINPPHIVHIPISSSIPPSRLDEEGIRRLREQEGIKPDELLVSYFGFISPHKGFDDLLEALARVNREGMKTKLLCIAELNKENEYHRELLARIERDRLGDCIEITGYVSEPEKVADYLKMTDFCILPFTSGVTERYSSYLAALAQGIRVITTSTSKKGYKEEDNTYYVPLGDVISLSKAIQELGAWKGAPGMASQRVLQWNQIAERTRELYLQLS